MLVEFDEAVAVLKSGGVVAIPTETVYGLAGRIDSEKSINQIFAIKKRPFFDPLIVHINGIQQARTLVAKWSEVADVLARKFWPGPVTLVLNKKENISSLITSGLSTVAIRCPRHSLTLKLITEVGVPLAAPSANFFGQVSPTQALHVEKEFHSKVPVLDGGSCEIGIESTVVAIRNGVEAITECAILREGFVSRQEIESCLLEAQQVFRFVVDLSTKESPGRMKHHYMPEVPLVYCRRNPRNESHLRLVVQSVLHKIPDKMDEVCLKRPESLTNIGELKLSDDPKIASRQLYQRLREASCFPTKKRPDFIYFVEPEHFRTDKSNWVAIVDRLTKASSIILDGELD